MKLLLTRAAVIAAASFASLAVARPALVAAVPLAGAPEGAHAYRERITDACAPSTNSPSAAHSVLDVVRAARAVPYASATSRFAVWSESQGGYAALWTAQLAARYAPELQLVGAAAGELRHARRLQAADQNRPDVADLPVTRVDLEA